MYIFALKRSDDLSEILMILYAEILAEKGHFNHKYSFLFHQTGDKDKGF